MKDKISQAKKMFKNAEDIANAVALSATTGFSGYYAYQNRGTIAVTLLGAAAAYSVIQAFVAWSKVLNK